MYNKIRTICHIFALNNRLKPIKKKQNDYQYKYVCLVMFNRVA